MMHNINYVDEIINILRRYNLGYVIIDEDSLVKIYKLLSQDILFEPITSCEFLYFGLYHRNITKNYVEMENNYIMAINMDNTSAMNNLGWYHEDITKDYGKAEKYYSMGVKKGNHRAMWNLGMYHRDITKNYIEMEKYLLLSVKNGDNKAIYDLITYYKNNNLDLKLLKLYMIDITNRNITNRNITNRNITNKNITYINITYINITSRDIIIQQFNKVSSLILNVKDKKKFLKLLTNFEFTHDDNLCVSLDLLLSSLKNNISIIEFLFTHVLNGIQLNEAKARYYELCLEK